MISRRGKLCALEERGNTRDETWREMGIPESGDEEGEHSRPRSGGQFG